ncbi:hypothetical protein [Pseudogulbenkiania sp. MAI-1]|uniref:hypothetical protein n=1 Tax=Pseudogulbenkiania sp. MAI-1 TaxID=990370 RepID=UPI00045E6943|nr:hypothetical protein [Pseudogulbenkiania sp. MAI-1]
MAKPRNLWPDTMQIWVVTGSGGSGKTTLGSTLVTLAGGYGIDAVMVDGVRDASQAESLLRMRTVSPDLLIMVTEDWPVPNMPRRAERVFGLNPGDAATVHHIAHQVMTRTPPVKAKPAASKEASHA